MAKMDEVKKTLTKEPVIHFNGQHHANPITGNQQIDFKLKQEQIRHEEDSEENKEN